MLCSGFVPSVQLCKSCNYSANALCNGPDRAHILHWLDLEKKGFAPIPFLDENGNPTTITDLLYMLRKV